MGHINFKYKLGQIQALPLGVNERYEDSFMIAHPITSLYDLSLDPVFEEFINARKESINHENTRVIDLTYYDDGFSNLGPNKFDEYYNTINVLGSLSIAFGQRVDARHVVNTQKDINLIQFPRLVLNFFDNSITDGSFKHTHKYLPFFEDANISVQKSSSATGYTMPTTTNTYIVPTYDNANITNYLNKFILENPFRYFSVGDPNPVYTDDYFNSSQGVISLRDTNPFYSKVDGISLDKYIENNYYNSDERRNNVLYDTTFTVPSVGVNLLVTTAIKRDIFNEEDLAYLRSQVGDIFYSVMGNAFVTDSESMEIISLLDKSNNFRFLRADYPDLYERYSIPIEKDNLTIREIVHQNLTPNEQIRPSSNRTLRQANSTSEVANYNGYTPVYTLDEDLVNEIQLQVRHATNVGIKAPSTTKVKAGSSVVKNIKAREVEKDTLPNNLTSSFQSSVVPSTENIQDLKVYPYVILKCKL